MATRPSARVTTATHRQSRGVLVRVIGTPTTPYPQALMSLHGPAYPDVQRHTSTTWLIHSVGQRKYPLCVERGPECRADLLTGRSGFGQRSRSAPQYVQAMVILLLVDVALGESRG